MKFTAEQIEEFREAAKPLLKWLNENAHPHCTAIVQPDRIDVFETLFAYPTDEFAKN